jgi:hypothetical protein
MNIGRTFRMCLLAAMLAALMSTRPGESVRIAVIHLRRVPHLQMGAVIPM